MAAINIARSPVASDNLQPHLRSSSASISSYNIILDATMSHVTPALLFVLSLLATLVHTGAAGILLHCSWNATQIIILYISAASSANVSRCSVSCELGSEVKFHGFGKATAVKYCRKKVNLYSFVTFVHILLVYS